MSETSEGIDLNKFYGIPPECEHEDVPTGDSRWSSGPAINGKVVRSWMKDVVCIHCGSHSTVRVA